MDRKETSAPMQINADKMTVEELHATIAEGLADLKRGNVQEASSAFAAFREKHQNN